MLELADLKERPKVDKRTAAGTKAAIDRTPVLSISTKKGSRLQVPFFCL